MKESEALRTSGEESRAMQAVRAGLAADGSFWDVFVRVCNNTEGVSELFGVRPDEVSKFTAKIRDMVREARENPPGREKKEMLPTGDNQENPE